MSKNLELKWSSIGFNRAYAEIQFSPSDGDTVINLNTVYSNVAGIDNLRPRAMEVIVNQFTQSPVTGTYVNMSIDNVSLPIFGRYRTRLDDDNKTLTIFAAQSNLCTLKFYSWDVFGTNFQDNSVTINGTVSIVDSAYSRTVNNQAYYLSNTLIVSANSLGIFEFYNPISSNINCYVEKMTLVTTQGEPLTMNLVNGMALGTADLYGVSKNFNTLINSKSSCRVATATIPPSYTTPFFNTYLTANTPYTYEFKEPLLLKAGGTHLIINNSYKASPTNFTVALEFLEVAQ